MKAFVLLVLSLCFLTQVLSASPGRAVDSNSDGIPDQWYEMTNGQIERVSMDRNFDTRIDYNVEYGFGHQKLYEELDFNHDGCMDDFYFFEEGKLIRQEVDTNYDGAVDVWVYLDGQYILRYEMDSNFDGSVDVIKDYSE